MAREHIIRKLDEPMDLVSPLIIVRKKDGNLLVCMDPRRINASLNREHYPIPRREDIEAELTGAKVFSRLDASSGFHQVPLYQSSSKVSTFATPFGR